MPTQLRSACLLAAFGLAALPALGQAQPTYSDEPLRADLLLSQEQWLRESNDAADWLGENYGRMPAEQWIDVRERLYLLIGLAVQHKYQRTDSTLLAADFPRGPELFGWANQLGVVGADLVASVLADSADTPSVEVAEHFSVAYDDAHLTLAAQDGWWSVHVPYYFMTWQLGRIPSDEHRTDVLVTSTLHALNSEQGGASQSTIMLLVSDEELDPFRDHWLGQFGLFEATPEPTAVPEGAVSYRATLEGNLRVEATVWRSGQKSVAVIYSGLTGPFEFNRVHAEDFIQHLSL